MDDKEFLEKIKEQNDKRISAMKDLRERLSELQKQMAVQAQQMKKIEDLEKENARLQAELDELKENRVSDIEDFQNKLIGGLTLSHIALGVLLLLL